MDHIRDELSQRNQHKCSAVQLGMGDRQTGEIQHHVSIEKDVQINEPGSITKSRRAT
jgi:hypothetical protein